MFFLIKKQSIIKVCGKGLKTQLEGRAHEVSPALLTNSRLGFLSLPGINTLAYLHVAAELTALTPRADPLKHFWTKF